MVVGLTGGIGSGKTTVLKMFQQFNNVAIYIADVEAKKLMTNSKEIKKKLIENFGKNCYKNHQLNKEYLSKIVFVDKKKLHLLNTIVHPEVHKHFANFVQNNKSKDYILYENAILFENKSDVLCVKIITVTAPKAIRINRVVDRDKTSKEAIENRIDNQWDDAKKVLQSHYLITNLDLEETKEQIFKIHKKLTKYSS